MLFAVLAAGVVALATASPAAELAANLAYRSPSLTIRSGGLEHDLNELSGRLQKRDGPTTWQGNVTYPWGIASGDPYEDSVILWTKPQKVDSRNDYPPICLHWKVASTNTSWGEGETVADGIVHTTSDVGFSVKVEPKNLKAYTQYYYRFENCVGPDAGTSVVGSFKTLPDSENDIESLRFAVFSCSNFPFGFFTAYGHAANNSEGLDYVTHLGDYIYEYANGDYGDGTAIGRLAEPVNREIVSLQDYRDRYASYRSDVDLQALHQNLAWFAVWDDHEIADNTYNTGSGNSNDTLAGQIDGVRFTERKKNAVKAYYEFMPIRQVDTDDKLRIWKSFKLGKLGDMFMLDTRQYDRSLTDLYYNTDIVAAMQNDTDRSLTGEKQGSWFLSELDKSKARGAKWRLVMQQLVFADVSYAAATGGSFDINYDSWSGYQYQRSQILSHIDQNNIDNVVILSGDSHVNWISDIPLNHTAYDPVSGNGSVAVEFAGTAVSSPSSYGRGYPDEQYVEIAQALVDSNPSLQYAEGNLRGYFALHITPNNASAIFYGFPDLLTRNDNVTLVATMTTQSGSNKLTRPLNDGQALVYGAIKK